MVGIRVLIAVAFPTFATILGFLWFHKKKKASFDEGILDVKSEYVKPDDIEHQGRISPQHTETLRQKLGNPDEVSCGDKLHCGTQSVNHVSVLVASPVIKVDESPGQSWPEESQQDEETADCETSTSKTAPDLFARSARKECLGKPVSSNNNYNRSCDRSHAEEAKASTKLTDCAEEAKASTKLTDCGNLNEMKISQQEKSRRNHQHLKREYQQQRDPRFSKSSCRADIKCGSENHVMPLKAHELHVGDVKPGNSSNLDVTEHKVADKIIKSNVEPTVDRQRDNSSIMSEQVSTDSGHEPCLSELTTTLSSETEQNIIYQFDFPTKLCGKLIGKNGRNINIIKDKSGTEIAVKRKLHTEEYQLVHLTGMQDQIQIAINMIKQRFPARKFRINYKEVVPDSEGPVLPAEIMQLGLPEGCTVDILVSSVVTPNHIFVQQPTHPTFPMLEKQNQFMMLCYAQDGIVPQLPRPVEVGVICAAPMFNGWYRAQIVQTCPETDECDVKFVDYGGYMRVATFLLRQIRSDFTSLPFQAVECYMANVVPPKGMDTFPSEANALLEQMVHGRLVQSEIVSHEEDGVPYVQLYDCLAGGAVLINRELVNQGVASWLELPSDHALSATG